jgi:2-haloacid dehalogenase
MDLMSQFRPKYITFDCYGTLTNFQMAEAAREVYGERLTEDRMQQFIKNFAAYRLNEILGAWKPYNEVVHNAVERTCKKNGVAFRDEDARWIY